MIHSLSLALMLAFGTAPAHAQNPAALKLALEAAAAKNWPEALEQGQAAGPLGAAIIEWQRLRDGPAIFDDYEAFLAKYPDWPGLPFLRKTGERVLGGVSPARVQAYFAPLAPQTGTGALALIAAYQAEGAKDKSEAEVIRAWRALPMTEVEQAAFIAGFGPLLKEHHGGRMVTMLAEGKLADAKRILDLVPAATKAIALARIALQEQSDGVDALIAQVPESLAGSAGLAYDRFIWRIRKNRYDEAADLMLERSDSVESLGDPQAWADWRRILARREMRQGDAKKAYSLAARHRLKEGSDYADLEWLAGYIALRKLNDAEAALGHFRRFRAAVNGPISLSRAGYWEGRAQEALNHADEARSAYSFAAEYQSAFYGQLAAEKLDLPLDPTLAGDELYQDWRASAFTSSSVFQAAVLLKAAGDGDLSTRFLLHLAEGLSGKEIGALAGLTLEWNEPRMAVLLAKAAADKGQIWPRAYFPLTGLEKLKLPVARELVLSIARRESEFNPSARSHAGALGLMQLMPGTAKLMAPKIGEAYENGRLTTDPDYNARLGAAYLGDLVAEFGTSPLLVASGYNAGPGRSRRWIEELGDPRAEGVDPVDWIEHIPFRETQTYVMRVAESLAIYRARLGVAQGPLRLSDELRGR